MIPNFTGWSRFAWLPKQYHCGFEFGYNKAHDTLIFTFNYGAVSVIMLFCYIRIYMVFRNSKKRIADAQQVVTRVIKMEEFRLAVQLFVV